MGPVAVKSHLAPFLPNHPLVADAGPETGRGYSTVTDFARLRGWSTSVPFITAT